MTITQWLFSFYGRIGRGRWWAALLVQLAIAGAAFGLAYLIDPSFSGIAAVIYIPALIVTVVMGYAVAVKRFHDLGVSGWWALLYPVAGAIGSAGNTSGNGSASILHLISIVLSIGLLIYQGAFPGEQGPNKYGPDPRNPQPMR